MPERGDPADDRDALEKANRQTIWHIGEAKST